MSAPSPPAAAPPTLADLWRQFLPLSVSDVTMAASEPLVATTLAHLPEARINLAALGVAKAIAIFLESPIIMVLHASNALAGAASARRALWRFVLLACAVLTAAVLVLVIPPVFTFVAERLLGVDALIGERGRLALLLLLLWPAAIGWRRYFQGLLIAGGHGGAVGRAGLGRIAVVALALALGFALGGTGAYVGAAAIAAGVIAEAVFVTVAARRRGVTQPPAAETLPGLPEDLPGVWAFYRPLATSMLVVWGGRAALVAVVARAGDASLALAAWPAAWSLVSVVSNATRMVQQVTIRHRAALPAPMLLGFALSVGAACSAGLLALGASPPGRAGVAAFVGGDPGLVEGVVPAVLVCALIPVLVAVQNGCQGLLIGGGATRAVNVGAWIGTAVLLGAATLAVVGGLPGATAAAIAMVVGYAAELAVLAVALRLAPADGPG